MIRETSFGAERLGTGRHSTLLQSFGQRIVTAYPVVEVAKGSSGSSHMGKIHEGKF